MSKSRKARRYPKARSPRPAHRAVWQRKNCQMCRRPVIVAEEQLGGGRLRGALLEPDPDQLGVLVRDGEGYVVRDYERRADGERWRWHDCPARNPR